MIVSQRLGRACTISFHTAYTVWHCTFLLHLQAAPALLIPLKMDITKMLRTITQQHKWTDDARTPVSGGTLML